MVEAFPEMKPWLKAMEHNIQLLHQNHLLNEFREKLIAC